LSEDEFFNFEGGDDDSPGMKTQANSGKKITFKKLADL
jgi:hypothetical protein